MSFIDKAFFYGTLKSDGIFYPMFSKYVIYNSPGYVFGGLYEYKNRPVFITDRQDKIVGEILTLSNTRRFFYIVDSIEYYLVRKEITVYYEQDDHPVKAYIYEFKNMHSESLTLIESGVWNNKK